MQNSGDSTESSPEHILGRTEDASEVGGSDLALQPLSDCDRDLFLDLIENPPEPNDTFRKATEAYRARHETE